MRSLPVALCVISGIAVSAGFAMPLAAQTKEFSAQAEAIPFPPDAREVEFDATFKDIEFESGSSLASLAAFYRAEMQARGWTEDAGAAEADEESAEMTFTHDGAKVVIELDGDEDEEDPVSVSMDCEGLDFSRTSDPGALIEAGVPQPRAYVFLQKETPRPEEIQDVQYRSDACHFKSPLELQKAFDFYLKELKGAGWRETRKPIVTGDRRYTEFKRGADELSVNIFEHEVGSRIILTYESDAKEPVVPPLPAQPGEPTGDAPAEANSNVAIDVSKNTGTSTVVLGAKKYTFKHVAAFRAKNDREGDVHFLYTSRPIPLQRMQAMLKKEGDISISDLFGDSFPQYLQINYGEYPGFSFNANGTAVSNSLDDPISDLKVADGRIEGSIKTSEPLDVFDENLTVSATVSAAIMTPDTRLGGPAPATELTVREAPFGNSELPLPEGASDVSSEGTRYNKTTHAAIDAAMPAVAAFYRAELTKQGWKEQKVAAGNGPNTTKLQFSKAGALLAVTLGANGERTTIDIVSNDDAKAKQDGVLPEPGKARLMLANGGEQPIEILIGKKSYKLKAGQGAEEPKQALNYSIAPGTYELTIKVPGNAAKTEKVKAEAGTTWAVMVAPNGETIALPVYSASGAVK